VSRRLRMKPAAVMPPDADGDLVIVMPGAWPPVDTKPAGCRQRLQRRLRQRWPAIRRALPRDLALVLLLFVLTRHAGLGWVLTDSVYSTVVVVLKGAAVRPGELAVFSYTGAPIPGYYERTAWSALMEWLGRPQSSAGPAKGERFVKYMLGLPGDRIELEGRQVWLVTGRGRINAGVCKTHSRQGTPLAPIAPQVIPAGYVYMWAPHVDALDSRYAAMGLVPAAAIAGRAVSLW